MPRIVRAKAATVATGFLCLLLTLVVAFVPPAFADSGGAGSNGAGAGSGGAGSATAAGASGNAGAGTYGGGGGGSGITGGNGGGGDGGGGGGAGATTAGGSGGAGTGGGGGGGGAHGAVVATTTTNGTNTSGGTGGTGGLGDGGGGSGGGGGGEGGYGTAINGAVTYGNSATVTGGNGGNGGDATSTYRGGQGGDGGFGLATGVTGATISNSGTIQGGSGGTGGASTGNGSGNGGAGGAGISASGATITNTGTITGGNGGAAGGGVGGGSSGAGGTGITGGNLTVTNSGTITAGTSGGGVQANAITFTGGTNTLQLQSGSTISGNVVASSTADTLQFGGTTSSSFDSSSLGVQYQGFGSYQKVGTSTWTITGTETSTTNWLISAGTLTITGSIASSTLTTVASGGTLLGTGTVGPTQINSGGIFSPGTANTPSSSMSVNGTLSFAAGSSYQVYLNPTTSSLANVTGTATLNGTVLVSFAGGTYSNKVYTILHSAGLGGSTFSGSTNSNLPAGFTATLTYTATDADINLTAILGQSGISGGSLNQNQQYVANALNNYFNSGGALPSAFTNIFAMTGSNLTTALSQLTGEATTAARVGGMKMTTQFMGMMLEPCVDGRLGGGSGCGTGNGGGLAGAAPSDALFCSCDVPAAGAPRWTAWGSTFGGGSTTYGNTAMGSNTVTASIFGFAAGMDNHVTQDSIVGLALSGGGTGWTLANQLGGGTSEAVQVGLYGMTRDGPAYAALGLAFTDHFMKVNRSAVGDQLTASFNAQSYGARVEGGYRFNVAQTEAYALGVTPYAAVQFQDFHTPAYGETDITGSGLGLSYGATDSTDTRTEIGARLDSPTVVDGRRLVLRTKAAWAHDFVITPGTTAAFEALPGSTFIVNGASTPPDAAIVSAGLEYYLTSRLTASAKFDGEFSGGSQSYGGSGTLRFSW